MSVQEWSRFKGLIELRRAGAIDQATFCKMWEDAQRPMQQAKERGDCDLL